MAESVAADLRQLLKDVIIPDVKALSTKMDCLQRQMEIHQKTIEAKSVAYLLEVEAMRTQMNA